MSSKLSRFLGSPFRLRGGEVLVELVILPHHLAPGVPQVMMQAPGHKYPAAEEQNGQSKKKKKTLFLCSLILMERCVRKDTWVRQTSEMDFRSQSRTFLSMAAWIVESLGSKQTGLHRLQKDTAQGAHIRRKSAHSQVAVRTVSPLHLQSWRAPSPLSLQQRELHLHTGIPSPKSA